MNKNKIIAYVGMFVLLLMIATLATRVMFNKNQIAQLSPQSQSYQVSGINSGQKMSCEQQCKSDAKSCAGPSTGNFETCMNDANDRNLACTTNIIRTEETAKWNELVKQKCDPQLAKDKADCENNLLDGLQRCIDKYDACMLKCKNKQNKQ